MSATSVAPHQVRAEGASHAVVPVRAEGVQLLGEMKGSGYRRPPALVRRADGQTITLTPLLYGTLGAIDGRRDLATIAAALSSAVDRHFTPEDVGYLVDTKLRPLGLVAGPGGAQPVTKKMNPLLALRFKFVISNPELTRRITAPFAWLFRPVVAVPLLLGFAVLSWWVLVDKGLAGAAHQTFYEPGFILAVWAMIVVSAGFHEFGHAAACRYGGATPGVMGAGLYLVWPAFYTEVSDSYRLGRAGRLRVDLGGLYFNAVFALATWAVWWATRWDALLLVIVAQHLQMVRQLAPFIRADGYHIIADLIGVPDLFAHIKPTLMSVLPRRWRRAGTPALKPWARAVVILWVAAVVPMLVSVIAMGVLLLPRLAATAWDSMGIQWQAATRYLGEGDLAGFTVRAVASLLVAMPVMALVYLLARLGRRTGMRAWKSTKGSPRKRAGVLVLAAAALAAVAWAWWPADQYRPIDHESGGTLPDVVRIEDHRIFFPLIQDRVALRSAPVASDLHREPSSTLSAGTTGAADSAGTAWSPLLAAVAPRDVTFTGTSPSRETGTATTREAWPFPFPMPDPPSEGDNRATAVNTTDNSVVTDLAVSWAIVTASEVDTRNEAWALASCEDCLTRAVAFQVLLLMEGTEVVTPLNAAVAANYECTRCTTEAIAVQLVVSITGMPSAEAQARIQEVMDKVEGLEANLSSLSAEQVYYVLRASQAEILQILDSDGQIPTAEISDSGLVSDSGAASPSPVTDGSAAGEPTPSAAISDTSSQESTGEGSIASEPTTAEASSEPTAEPTSEPSSEPTSEPTSDPTTGDSTEPTPTTSEPSP